MASVVSTVVARVQELGFEKRAAKVMTKELSADVLGWLGLNTATKHQKKGVVEINPVIGVRHQEVERVVAELRGEAFHAYQPPTVSTPLGYLMPESRYRGWVVDAEAADDPLDDLVEALTTYAVPFMESAASMSRLCELLDEGLGHDHQVVYRRPVAWQLAGDSDRSIEAIDSAEADLGDRRDAAADELRAFVSAFRDRYSLTSSG